MESESGHNTSSDLQIATAAREVMIVDLAI